MEERRLERERQKEETERLKEEERKRKKAKKLEKELALKINEEKKRKAQDELIENSRNAILNPSKMARYQILERHETKYSNLDSSVATRASKFSTDEVCNENGM